ncbi:MAG: hypothetical protein H0W48_06615 [Methylibium sp.]|nr:hypothetical protein [Methylibium sp.]
MAHSAGQALEKRPRIDPLREREVLAADLAVAGGVAEIQLLANRRAGDFHLHVHRVFVDVHVVLVVVEEC